MQSKIDGLYAIIDNSFSLSRTHLELANLVLLGGCKLIQLRIKPTNPKMREHAYPYWRDDVLKTARDIMKLKNKFDFTLIINDYVDVAGELGADGVHIGSNDISVTNARNRLGRNFLIGYSSHSIDEALAAERLGADYIAFGAIYHTKTKGVGHPVQGIEKLRKIMTIVKKPIVAIGGINRSNIDDIIKSGAASFAMITGITQSKDIVEEVKWYVTKFSHSAT